MSESCSSILAKTLLFAPQDFCERIKHELNEILRVAGVANVDDPDFNPVKKVLLLFLVMKVISVLK
jgi:hypothetical protein